MSAPLVAIPTITVYRVSYRIFCWGGGGTCKASYTMLNEDNLLAHHVCPVTLKFYFMQIVLLETLLPVKFVKVF